METTVNEINDGIYRLSTFVPEVSPEGFTFNQILIDADEPMLFHLGHRGMFPLISEAAATVVPLDRLRWLSFGHVEADESGAINQWLDAAPNAQVMHGQLGVMVSIGDLADREPRALGDGETVDLGGKRVRWLQTPHVPHGWEAGVFYEETTNTLLCGDLFTRTGTGQALVEGGDIVAPALAAEDMFMATCLTPATGPTMRRLADLQPETLALMHGSSFRGDGGAALNALADAYDARLAKAEAAS